MACIRTLRRLRLRRQQPVRSENIAHAFGARLVDTSLKQAMTLQNPLIECNRYVSPMI